MQVTTSRGGTTLRLTPNPDIQTRSSEMVVRRAVAATHFHAVHTRIGRIVGLSNRGGHFQDQSPEWDCGCDTHTQHDSSESRNDNREAPVFPPNQALLVKDEHQVSVGFV